MPKECAMFGCSNHHLMKDKKRSFFTLPDAMRSPNRRNKWILACRRTNDDGSEWKPISKFVYICSDHFVTGQCQNTLAAQQYGIKTCIYSFITTNCHIS